MSRVLSVYLKNGYELIMKGDLVFLWKSRISVNITSSYLRLKRPKLGVIFYGEDFVTDGDEIYFGLWVKWEDVIGYPGLGSGEFSYSWNVAVFKANGDGDVGVGKGFEDVRVGVQGLDAVDDGLGSKK
nr:hypothetical protein CFP56_02318 [Quercus suber]